MLELGQPSLDALEAVTLNQDGYAPGDPQERDGDDDSSHDVLRLKVTTQTQGLTSQPNPRFELIESQRSSKAHL